MTEELEFLLDSINSVLSEARKLDGAWHGTSFIPNGILAELKDAYVAYVDELQEQYSD